MISVQGSFEFDYEGVDIIYGRESISGLGTYLKEQGVSDALVVCGSNVGSNNDLMDPVTEGLGDTLAGVFDETAPDKLIETAYDGIDAMRETNADVLVGVGGGSSLDIARQISVFEADGRSLTAIKKAARNGKFEPSNPEYELTPIVLVPTTFAGADISFGSVVEILPAEESPTGLTLTGGGSIDPTGVFYDPDLFETTPMIAITGSAMNGFNKGLERIYSNRSTPITDATAIRGLQMLQAGLPNLPGDTVAMERAVVGIILVQFARRLSIIHAFAHGYTRRYPVQQGKIHGILAPHVLRYIFDQVDARRRVLAEGFEIDSESLSDEEVAEAIVTEVAAVRDALNLPTQLREIEVIDDDFRDTAEFIMNDRILIQGPDGLDPTTEEIEILLQEAW